MTATPTWLRDALASWGLLDIFGPSSSQGGRSDVVLAVYWLGGEGDRVRVGSVSHGGGEYVFRYDPGFCASPDAFAVIPAFPSLSKEYRSESLWPFLSVRLPPLERSDAKAILKEKGINPDDPSHRLRLIEVLGGKSPVSPFELSLSPV